MNGSATTGRTGQGGVGTPGATRSRAGRRRGRWVAAAAALSLALGACTSTPAGENPAPAPSATAPSASAPGGASTSAAPTSSGAATPSSSRSGSASGASSSAAAPSSTDSPPGDALIIDVTLSGGDVTPNGQKISARVGQQVQLEVLSDRDDVIHAHTGGDGFELKVSAGAPRTGIFTLESAGSFEVESHELDKVIVILNAR